jgi:tetratricopeptide (TPR) repeat protein
MARLDLEQANLRASMLWTIQQAERGDPSAVVLSCRMVAALWWFWHIRGHFGEARDHIDAAMTLLRAFQRPIQSAMPPATWSNMHARMLLLRGAFAIWAGADANEQAVQTIKDSLVIFRQLGQQHDVAFTLTLAGYGAQVFGDFANAETLLREAVAVYEVLDDRRGIALALQGIGMIALRRGDYEDAATSLKESLHLFTNVRDERSIAASRATLGAVCLRQGELDHATALLSESLRARHELGDKGGIAWCFEWLAEAAIAGSRRTGGPHRAARLLGAARELRAAISSPIDPIDRADHERVVATVQSQLSDPAFVAAWEAGRVMSLQDAVAYALESDRSGG